MLGQASLANALHLPQLLERSRAGSCNRRHLLVAENDVGRHAFCLAHLLAVGSERGVTSSMERAVAVELQPNQASLHDGRIIHGSEANHSALRRCGYTMRYVSTRSRFDRRRHPWHQMYLARGTDHAGNEYGDPHRAYPDIVKERASALTGH